MFDFGRDICPNNRNREECRYPVHVAIVEEINIQIQNQNLDVYWTVRLINWSIPLGLLFAACYALNQDYNINVLNYLSVWFPREASIFQRMAGNEDIDYGIKMKQ